MTFEVMTTTLGAEAADGVSPATGRLSSSKMTYGEVAFGRGFGCCVVGAFW